MAGYKQMNEEERLVLYDLLHSGQSVKDIAEKLQRHKSTIYREVKRNVSSSGAYLPDYAHKLAQQRCQRPCLLQQTPPLRDFVININPDFCV